MNSQPVILLITRLAMTYFLIGNAQAALAQATDSDVGTSDVSDSQPIESTEEIVVVARSFLPDANVSSTKIDQPLAETAQSITVLDEEIFEALGLRNYLEGTDIVPGVVNAGLFGGTPVIYSRGYLVGRDASYKVNGIPIGAKPLDNIAVNRLEFVKGGSGTTFGEGGPGGFMNLITRKPTEQKELEVSASAGSYEFYRVMASASGPITDDESTRALVSAAYQQSNWFVDFEKRESLTFFASLTSDWAESVSMTLNTYYGDFEYNSYNDGWPAVHIVDDEGNLVKTEFADQLPWKLNTGQPWNRDVNEYLMVNGQIDFNVSDRSTFSIIGGYTDMQYELILFDICCSISSVDYTSDGYSWFGDFRIDNTYAELRFSGDFDTSRVQTRYLISTEYRSRSRKEGFARYSLVVPGYDLLDPQYDVPSPFAGLSKSEFITRANQREVDLYSVSAMSVSYFGDWIVTLGARHDEFEPHNRSFRGYFDPSTEFLNQKFPSDNTALRGAVMYEVVDGGRVYASYGETFEINNGRTCDGSVLPPETGKINEIGYKQELNDQKLLLTVALYDIETVGNTVPVTILECPDAGDQSVKAGDGTASKGWEVEFVGQIADNFNVVGGYAYNDTVVRTPNGHRKASNIAPKQWSLFGTYDIVGGPLNGFGASLGAVYLDDRIGTTGATEAEQLHLDSRLRADAAIYYHLNDQISFSLHVRNLTDEKDPSVPFSTGEFQHMWLEPRNYQFTIDWAM